MEDVERARHAAEAQQEAAAQLPRTELARVLTTLAKYPRRPLLDLADFLPAKSIATAGDADVIAITTACLSELFFDESGLKNARMRTQDVLQSTMSPGEILIARSNTPDLVGRACLFPGSTVPIVATDLTIRLQAHLGTNAAFLARYFSCLFLTGYWKERASGASGSMKKITRSQLRAEQVPSPPEPDQQRIADDIAARMSSIQNLTSSLHKQSRLIGAFPAALLREAFSGRL
jgi:type I restriction enzyme S subunit